MLRWHRVFQVVMVALSCAAMAAAQQQEAAPQKPTYKSDQVQNTDPIALLAVRGEVTSAPVAASKPPTAIPADEASRKAALATIEKQIKEKQDHIILLMRLFVDDEKKFVIDPTNPQVDPAVKERRKYEQDELLWETAELAKLKAKRDQLSAVPR